MLTEQIQITLILKKKHAAWLREMAEKDGIPLDAGISVIVAKVIEDNKGKIKKGLKR